MPAHPAGTALFPPRGRPPRWPVTTPAAATVNAAPSTPGSSCSSLRLSCPSFVQIRPAPVVALAVDDFRGPVAELCRRSPRRSLALQLAPRLVGMRLRPARPGESTSRYRPGTTPFSVMRTLSQPALRAGRPAPCATVVRHAGHAAGSTRSRQLARPQSASSRPSRVSRGRHRGRHLLAQVRTCSAASRHGAARIREAAFKSGRAALPRLDSPPHATSLVLASSTSAGPPAGRRGTTRLPQRSLGSPRASRCSARSV